MTQELTAQFNQSRNDLSWTLYTPNHERLYWSGYNDKYWWDNVSKSEQFTHKKGIGGTYILNPNSHKVAFVKDDAAKVSA